jgi:hypothetical protein
MDEEAAFRDKWQRRIDGCGPYCSCLVIVIVLALAFFAFVIRCSTSSPPFHGRNGVTVSA